MKFQPVEELAPGTPYDFEIIRGEDTLSQAGNPMLVVTLRVFNAQGAPFVLSDRITDKAWWKLKALAEAIGLLADYKAGCLDAPTLAGLRGRCEIKNDPEFGPQIAKYLKPAAPERKMPAFPSQTRPAAEPAPAPQPAGYDAADIPF